jgi:hypothetical protein
MIRLQLNDMQLSELSSCLYGINWLSCEAVPVWLEYVQYSIGGMGDEGGTVAVRDTFEKALTAAGLHITSGSILWEAYREFENAVLAGMQPEPGSVPSSEVMKLTEAQMARITKLFQRQLSVPLQGSLAVMFKAVVFATDEWYTISFTVIAF